MTPIPSTSASATSSRAATSSSASTSRAQASALARTPEPTARAGQAQGTAAQTQPQQTTGQATGAGQVAAQTRQTTVATEEQLLDAIGAATDPGASQVDRAEWAADGKTARTTLSEIVRMRNTTGQPSLDVTDIVFIDPVGRRGPGAQLARRELCAGPRGAAAGGRHGDGGVLRLAAAAAQGDLQEHWPHRS